MIPQNSYAAATIQVAKHPVEVDKLEWRSGDSFGSTVCYLQFWDTQNQPSDPNAKLLKSYPIYGASAYDYKEFKRGDMSFTLGCWVGVSTTEATYTAGNGTTQIWAMLSVELIRPEQPLTTSYAGDLTTAVSGLQVWSEATGATTKNKLVALEIDGTNLTGGGIQYVQVFGKDTVNTGDIPCIQFPIASGGTAIVSKGVTIGSVLTGLNAKRFGDYATDILYADTAVPPVYHYGCTVKISSTSNSYTACNGTVCLKAEYAVAQQ
jgi:hypothetical protein